MYRKAFTGLISTITAGLVAGLVISFLLSFMGDNGMNTQLCMSKAKTLSFCLGPLFILILVLGQSIRYYLEDSFAHMDAALRDLRHMGHPGSRFLHFIYGFSKLEIGLSLIIPVGIFRSLLIVFDLPYLGIMSLLERNHLLENRERLCHKLDGITPTLAGIITAIIWVTALFILIRIVVDATVVFFLNFLVNFAARSALKKRAQSRPLMISVGSPGQNTTV